MTKAFDPSFWKVYLYSFSVVIQVSSKRSKNWSLTTFSLVRGYLVRPCPLHDWWLWQKQNLLSQLAFRHVLASSSIAWLSRPIFWLGLWSLLYFLCFLAFWVACLWCEYAYKVTLYKINTVWFILVSSAEQVRHAQSVALQLARQ